ncbi:MAG TPA: hypothetical protein PKU97_05915, partial [Kofleriaceae bacterium]|nr:hypothetical protein [Kofleriaceae bacterium]
MPPPLASPFVIDCPLQLAIGEHPQVAIVEPERVVVVELPSGALVAELGLQVEAEGVDVGWLGPTPRLLVVSRLPDHTQLHLLDITEKSGIRVCAEKRVEVAMRLLAVSGNYGLLCGAVSSAVLTRADDNVTMHPVAARGVPSAAGPLGNQLVVALPGVIELWDPVARVAKRRLKLPRPAQLRAVGGSERQIWLTTLAEPHRLEVLPLINRGQPKAHELDEPIAAVAGHPRLDVVVCTGADSGQVYVIDLDGRTPIRALGTDAFGGPPMALALLGGRTPAIVAVAAGQPPTLLALDGLPLTEWPGAPRAEGASSSVVAVPAASPAGAAPGAAAEPRRAEAREVFDSKLGHNVADPHPASAQQQPDNPRSIAGAATVLRAARADTRDGATDEEDPHRPKATPNEPATAGATGALLDRLASWRARTADEQLVDQQLEPGSVTTSGSAPVAVSQGASPRQLAPEATPGTTTATTTAAPPATTSATTPGTATAAPPPLAPAAAELVVPRSMPTNNESA